MTTKEFIKQYKTYRRLKTLEEAKIKIDNFWKTLEEEIKREKILFKNYGKFEIKELKERKYILPNTSEVKRSENKIKIAFKCGKYLKNDLN